MRQKSLIITIIISAFTTLKTKQSLLLQEQSQGHAKALQKSEKRMENFIKTKKPFKEHVTLESRLGHLRYSERWD